MEKIDKTSDGVRGPVNREIFTTAWIINSNLGKEEALDWGEGVAGKGLGDERRALEAIAIDLNVVIAHHDKGPELAKIPKGALVLVYRNKIGFGDLFGFAGTVFTPLANSTIVRILRNDDNDTEGEGTMVLPIENYATPGFKVSYEEACEILGRKLVLGKTITTISRKDADLLLDHLM